MSDSNPKVILKRAKIQVMVDYCLDQAMEFSVKQQDFPDTDWIVELNISDINLALQTGMFLRENRFEVEGLEASKPKKATKKAAKKEEPVIEETEEEEVKEEESKDEEITLMEDESSASDDKKSEEQTEDMFASAEETKDNESTAFPL